MNLREYCQYDGLGLAELVRQREVSPRELAECSALAIDRVNPVINAVIDVYQDRLEPGQIREGFEGCFGGVPFLLKDTGAGEQGRAQTCGSRIGRGFQCNADSYLAKLYRESGLNIVGRSAMPEFAMAATTESACYGATRNPWDLERSAGGSSGGAAAAVAAGIVPLAHGTDTGGSIRIPAACCGLVGLKPSRGRISKGPGLDETLYGGLNTEHVITRSVRDCAAALDATAFAMPGDPMRLPAPRGGFLRQLNSEPLALRIAFTTRTFEGSTVDPVIAVTVEQVARFCESLGHTVEEATPVVNSGACVEADEVVWTWSTFKEVQRVAGATRQPVDSRFLEPPVLEACERGRHVDLQDWFEAMACYLDVRRQSDLFFDEYDLLLTPTVSSPPPLLGEINSNRDIGLADFLDATGKFCPHTPLANITGQPAISLPLGGKGSLLPVGVQFCAAPGRESLLLRLAAVLETSTLWCGTRPPLNAAAEP